MKTNGFDQVQITGKKDPRGHAHGLAVDPTGAAVMVSQLHYHIQEGECFTVFDWADLDTITAEPNKEWLFIKDGSDLDVHWTYHFEADNPGTLEFFFNPTVTDNGVEIVPSNNDMNSANTLSSMTFYKDPTVTADGVQGVRRIVGSTGVGPKGGAGGTNELDLKFIMKDSTTFLMRFIPKYDETKVALVQTMYEIPKDN